VLNFGVDGYSTDQAYLRYQRNVLPWRPLVSVADIPRGFMAVLQAPRELVHNQSFNVGRSEENYQIRGVAAMAEEIVPGSRVKYAEGGGPDLRCYRVNCDKIARTLSEFQQQ
jgi:nucleoside-diphosphate-sugar epimerase